LANYRESRLEKARSRQQNMKRILFLLLIALLVGAGAGVGMNFLFGKQKTVSKQPASRKPATSQPSPIDGQSEKGQGATSRKKPAAPAFKVSQAMAHTFALSEQIGPRPAGSVRETGTADYIVQRLGEYGYNVEEQQFTMQDGFGSRNIIASVRGTREGFVMIVGSHYDSAAEKKGAVDNGSGVGVVLELARVFYGLKLEPTIKFVFFGSNAPGRGDVEERLNGSRRYVELLGSMEKRDVVGMISIDQVAQGENMALRTREAGLQRLKAKLETFATEHEISTTSLKATNDSDNMPFEDAGIPAVWVEWCDPGGGLNTDDTYNSVVPGKVEAAGTLIESFLYDLTPDDLEELKY